MPLTVLQKQVLRILAANRSEESHFAGGLVLNAGEDSPRYSHDFDIFHEAEAEVARASVRIPTQTGHQSDLKSDSVPIQSGQCSD